jgi:3'(2'), 5'-bisphosphate nucleotidase
MNDTLAEMIEIARAAATEIMKIYAQPFEVQFKGPSDPVTEADRIANQLICSRPAEAFPEIPIIAEESHPGTWVQSHSAERVFFVDPVDGTREFVAKNDQFVVMIGLLEGDRPTHGVLYAPVARTLWAGVVGEGAFRREADGSERVLAPISRVDLSESRVVSSRSNRQAQLNTEALERLSPAEIVPIGSAGLKGAAVADGSADIYLAPGFAGCLWDSCAPEALIRSVGGVYTDAHGVPLDYRATTVENHRGAVAASPLLHSEVIARISDLLR